MTTDPTSAGDRAARLEALRQRRVATRPAPPADSVEPAAATAAPQRRARRRHAATGGRILAGGLSAAAALGLIGAMAHATGPSTDTSTTPIADASGTPAVIVVRRTTGASVAAPVPQVTATTAAPVATSQGS